MSEPGEFKTCPFCKEQIRAEAVKCRFCAEWLGQPPNRSEMPKGQEDLGKPLQSSPEPALLSSPAGINGTASTSVPLPCVPASSTRYRVEYRGQNSEAVEIKTHSPEEAASLFVAQDSKGRHEDYSEIVVFWGRFGRNQQSFKTKDLLPPAVPPLKPTSTVETQAPAQSKQVGLVWLRIWNYAILPYCVLMLLLFIIVNATSVIHRGLVQARPQDFSPDFSASPHSPALLGATIGFVIAATFILGLAAFLAGVIVGLHKRRAWVWKANWVAVGFVAFIILLTPNPFTLIPFFTHEHQQAGISPLSFAIAFMWIMLNLWYFRSRCCVFGVSNSPSGKGGKP
jgi:hypothetical protein